MGRRAQLSHFLIIGLMILAAALFAIMLQEQRYAQREGVVERAGTAIPQKAAPIKQFMEGCIAQSGNPAVRLLALQGGRLDFSNVEYFTSEIGNQSYALDGERVMLPSRAAMEQDLAAEMVTRLRNCVGDFGELRKQWESIYAEPLAVNASIAEDTVVFRVRYPLTLVDKDGTTRISDFSARIPLRLGHTHDLLQNITSAFSRNPEWIDATLLSELSTQEIRIAVMPQDAAHYLLTVTDNASAEPFVFIAAVRIPENDVPKITLTQTAFAIPEEQPFTLHVTARDDGGVVFSDDTTLFDIDPSSGSISFTPQVPGTEQVRITATDAQGKFDEVTLTFTVTEAEA